MRLIKSESVSTKMPIQWSSCLCAALVVDGDAVSDFSGRLALCLKTASAAGSNWAHSKSHSLFYLQCGLIWSIERLYVAVCALGTWSAVETFHFSHCVKMSLLQAGWLRLVSIAILPCLTQVKSWRDSLGPFRFESSSECSSSCFYEAFSDSSHLGPFLLLRCCYLDLMLIALSRWVD